MLPDLHPSNTNSPWLWSPGLHVSNAMPDIFVFASRVHEGCSSHQQPWGCGICPSGPGKVVGFFPREPGP